jgi:hypothetical protein
MFGIPPSRDPAYPPVLDFQPHEAHTVTATDAVEQDQETAPEPIPPHRDNPPMEANTPD